MWICPFFGSLAAHPNSEGGETLTGTGLGLWERERLLEALDAHQRGLSDAPLLHKWTESQAGQIESKEDQPMPFVISTDEVDRHGDVIVAQGWQLDAYQNNPVS